jgi:hypothetical protein
MAAAAAEWDSGSEAGPTGDRPSAAASPVKGNAALPEESDAGASASGSSEAKVDDGNIQEAESSLREGLSLNYEVCGISPPPVPVLKLIWEGESSYCGRGLVEMRWEDRIFLVNASLCDALVAFGGRSGCEEGSRFRISCSSAKLNVLTKMAFFVSVFFHFI